MRIAINENDDPRFIEQVEAVTHGIATSIHPTQLILIRIRDWFGPKWLPFSAATRDPDLGVAPNHLSLPIFVPNRVLSQRTFVAPEFKECGEQRWVHVPVRSSNPRYRLMSDLASDSALFWYSAGSKKNGRGAAMAYLPMGPRYHEWYASWEGNEVWKLTLTKGTGVQDLTRFAKAGDTIREQTSGVAG